jgi:hypothetical protein
VSEKTNIASCERDIELEARFANAVKSKEFKFILENLFLVVKMRSQ